MVNNIIEITAKRVRGHKARPGKTTGSHINGRTAKGAQSPLGSDINKWIDSVRQYKEIMTMNDKEFRKLMKDINDAHSVLEAYQEQVLSHASSIVSKIEKNNQNKDEEALESLRLIKDQLRQVQFTDDKEFESEQLITRIDRITKNTTKGNNARIDNEWDKYFELLEDYMKEKGHCYFEPPKKNKNGKLIYQNYKGEKLGEWVDNIRKGRNKLDGEKLTKLVNLAVDQRYIIKLARNHEIIVDILEEKGDILSNEAVGEFGKIATTPLIPAEFDSTDIEAILIEFAYDERIKYEYVTADIASADLNKIRFKWSNNDASWMRYFYALRDFYCENLHSYVPAKYIAKTVDGDLDLGTWVLRQRQEWKKNPSLMATMASKSEKTKVHFRHYNNGHIDRDQLLYQIYFIYETNFSAYFDVDAPGNLNDIIGLSERIAMARSYPGCLIVDSTKNKKGGMSD